MPALPISVQVITDTFLFVIVCLPLVLLQTLGKPVVGGFWCHDQWLSYPYKADTVPQSLLLTVSFGLPFLVVAVTESVRAAVNLQPPMKFTSEMMNLAKAYSIFLFGMTINCIFTDAIKFSVGRPRPHFFDVCKPDFSQINCTTDTGMARIFNTNLNRPPIYATDDITNSLLDTRDMCGDVGGFDALIIVHTAVTHFDHRQRYRDTYGNFEFTRPYRLKIVFFLGQPSEAGVQSEILRENTQDGDTVQGNFTDTYQNLTYKAVMAYRWVSQNCRKVKVILKMDDDVILDVHRFFEEFVLPPVYQQELIFCHIWTYAGVERTGKWGISLLDYKGDFYPPYCSGFIVVVMPAIVEDLYEMARDTPFLWLDDVFIYGVVRQEMRDVQLVNLDEVAFREEHYIACYRQYGYRYITRYTCTNRHIEKKWLHDSVLSFPSGHTSVATYSATFIILYLHVRMNTSISYLLKPTLQACTAMLALYCSITRVTDHKHFTTDVLAGSILGASIAWAVFYRIACQIFSPVIKEGPPHLSRALSVESEPRTPTPLLRPEKIVIDQSYKNSVAISDSKGGFSHTVLSI